MCGATRKIRNNLLQILFLIEQRLSGFRTASPSEMRKLEVPAGRSATFRINRHLLRRKFGFVVYCSMEADVFKYRETAPAAWR